MVTESPSESKDSVCKDPKIAILEALRKRPGSSIADIHRFLECSHPNASRHLRTLAKEGRTEYEKESRTSHHFLAQDRALHIRMLPFFRDPENHRTIQILASEPDREWNYNTLAGAVRTHHSRVSKLIKSLQNRGLVQTRRWNTRYYVRGTPRLEQVVNQHEQSEYAQAALEARKEAIKKSRADTRSSPEPDPRWKIDGSASRLNGNGRSSGPGMNGGERRNGNGTLQDQKDRDESGTH